MLAMDQFKDIRGYTRYASRLRVGWRQALRAWLTVAYDETLGGLLRHKLGPQRIDVDACEPELVRKHLQR
jgi:hypothetical protein